MFCNLWGNDMEKIQMPQISPKIYFQYLDFWAVKYPKEIKAFGSNIKKLRKAAKLTQQALADDANVSRKTIQRIENGEYVISIETIFGLACALNVEIDVLFSPIKLSCR